MFLIRFILLQPQFLQVLETSNDRKIFLRFCVLQWVQLNSHGRLTDQLFASLSDLSGITAWIDTFEHYFYFLPFEILKGYCTLRTKIFKLELSSDSIHISQDIFEIIAVHRKNFIDFASGNTFPCVSHLIAQYPIFKVRCSLLIANRYEMIQVMIIRPSVYTLH